MLIFYKKITVHFYLKYCYIRNVKKLLAIISILFFSSSLLAEFRMERVICTTKKTSNCGAYIYNSKTGEVYFCNSEECKVVDTPIEIFIEEEEEEIDDNQGSLIPKKPKKKESKIPKKPKKKESKIPKKPKKKESKIPKKPDKCDKESKIPKKGC